MRRELKLKNAYIGGLAIHKKDIRSFIDHVKKEGIIRALPVKIKTKDGNLKDIIVSGTQMTINGKNTILTSYSDITRLKKTEEELKKSSSNCNRQRKLQKAI